VIKEISKADINRSVLYTAPFPGSAQERGVVTSYNSNYVFVRFGNELHSKACRYQNLEWEHSAVIKTYSFNFSRLGKCGREWFNEIQIGQVVPKLEILKKVYTNCKVVAKDEETGVVRISYE
jgi:hypothetical protein